MFSFVKFLLFYLFSFVCLLNFFSCFCIFVIHSELNKWIELKVLSSRDIKLLKKKCIHQVQTTSTTIWLGHWTSWRSRARAKRVRIRTEIRITAALTLCSCTITNIRRRSRTRCCPYRLGMVVRMLTTHISFCNCSYNSSSNSPVSLIEKSDLNL